MSHLDERITDYLMGEMSTAEKNTADVHLGQCSLCAGRLEEFRHTYALLQTVPDAEPPRPLVFAEEKRIARPAAGSMVWRWLAPAFSAAAASIITALILSPAPSDAPPSATSVNVASPSTVQPAIDVQKIVSEFRVSNEQSLAAGLDERGRQAMQRAQSEMDYWERQQRAVSRGTLDTARTIQLLAQKVSSED
jgi:anti-sigma factor RsiW